MDLHDFSDMGDQIKNRVQDAVDTMNFEGLNQEIKQTVYTTFRQKNPGFYYTPRDDQGNEIRSGSAYQAQDRANQAQDTARHTQGWTNYRTGSTSYGKNQTSSKSFTRTTYRTRSNYASYSCSSSDTSPQTRYQPKPAANMQRNDVYDVGFPVYKNPPGTISGPLFFSFGLVFGIASGFIDILSLSMIMFAHDTRAAGIVLFSVFFPVFIASVLGIIKGSRSLGRIRRYKTYLRSLKENKFASFKTLGTAVGKSDAFVYRDVTDMLKRRYFPEGHIDEQKTCLMVTNDIYNQYLLAQESMKARGDADAAAEATREQMDEFQSIISEGKRYMQRIREANDAIPDTDFSNKLYRMELIVGKIFDYVAKHPEQIGQLRRFMDYYMPTTDKLVTAYRDFDAQPITGEHIQRAKSEISDTLDTINEAYEKLYDDLHAREAMDLSSDIAVLQTLLAQEGLTGGAFKKDSQSKQD